MNNELPIFGELETVVSEAPETPKAPAGADAPSFNPFAGSAGSILSNLVEAEIEEQEALELDEQEVLELEEPERFTTEDTFEQEEEVVTEHVEEAVAAFAGGRFVEVGIGGHPVEVYKQLAAEGLVPAGRETNIKLMSFQAEPYVQAEQALDAGELEEGAVGVYIMYLGNGEVKDERIELTGKCTIVNEEPFKGQRKWETYHVIYDSVTNQALHKEVSKTDAVKWAKEYVTSISTPNDLKRVYLKLEKHLAGSKPFIAEYEPQLKKVSEKKVVPQNRYLFFGN